MRVKIHSDVCSTSITNETIVLHHPTGRIFALNSTGEFIWKRLSSGLEMDDTAQQLAKEYEILLQRAQEDVGTFVNLLCSSGLVEVSQQHKT